MSDVAIDLDGVVNIAKVEALHHQLEDILKHGTPAKINAAEVSRVDTAALQLLVAFFKSMKSAQVDVSWNDVSEELTAAAMLVGMEKDLCLA